MCGEVNIFLNNYNSKKKPDKIDFCEKEGFDICKKEAFDKLKILSVLKY